MEVTDPSKSQRRHVISFRTSATVATSTSKDATSCHVENEQLSELVSIAYNMAVAVARPSPVVPGGLKLPIFERLKDKRVVLASSSPRRKDILENVVSGESVEALS